MPITINKAIKNLTAGRKDAGMIPEDEYTPTCDLAIEALQFFQEFQKVTGSHQDARLPSETEE